MACRRGCLGVLVAVLLVGVVWGREREPISKEEFPNPRTDFDKCGRGKESWICDPGQFLNASDGDRLDNMVEFMKDAQTCLCDDKKECYGDYRHEILVAIVPRIKYSNGELPDNYVDQKAATKDFAEYLRNDAWKSQGKQCRMRAFIVFDMHTKVVWTATNYYALKLISDRQAKGVGLDAKTEFLNKGKTFEGIESMIYQYRNFLFEADKYMTDDPKGDRGKSNDKGPEYKPEPEGVPWWKPFTGVLTTLLLIVLIVVICFCVCRNVDWMAPGRPGGIWFPSGGGPSFGVAACSGGGWRGGGGCGGGGCGGGGWKSGGGGCGGGGGFGGGGDGGGGDDGGGGGDDGGGGGCGGGGGSACGADGDNAKCGGGGGG